MPVILAVAGALFFALLMMAVMPVLALFFGALGGWIIQVTVGDWVVQGGAIVGLTIPHDAIWKLAAFLAFVGAYVKPVPSASASSK